MTEQTIADAGAAPAGTPPPDLAPVLRPALPALAEEIAAEIRAAVPEFARPPRGRFGAGLRLGVEQGLRHFVERIADPAAPRDQAAGIYRSLGRGEYLEGRSLDPLQLAYRVGGRVAWRRFARVGHERGVAPERLYVLAEAILAYVEEISAHSVDAYAELAARTAGLLQRRRDRLLRLLLAEPAVTAPDGLHELAGAAQWPLPRTVTCVALRERWSARHVVGPALGPDVLMDLERPDPCLLVPDPDGPGRMDALRRGLRDVEFAVGPVVPLPGAPLSLRLARHALSLMRRGVFAGERQVDCEDHLPTLLLLGNENVARILVRRRLAGFADLRTEQHERLAETLLTWLATGASVPAVAARLCVHPQTIRYRLRQLRDLFGDLLNDPDWRFEMELALRIVRLLDTRERDRAPGAAGAGPAPERGADHMQLIY
ncbi:PucR family transcriptional regulator [Actinomadura fibrosa]|uniref:PucR family transcriptional regulator n=1 Tax=Actinomadura fibrosa TaxID=111802 RepID=A0ABW2XWG6_9ACTN|nr:PucR family transcriptional regulator [Actinomadura fibrosa]